MSKIKDENTVKIRHPIKYRMATSRATRTRTCIHNPCTPAIASHGYGIRLLVDSVSLFVRSLEGERFELQTPNSVENLRDIVHGMPRYCTFV